MAHHPWVGSVWGLGPEPNQTDAHDKCQEVVILMKIYGTFVTCSASYQGKKPRVNWILSIHALPILLYLILQESYSRHWAKMENKQQSATRQK